MLQPNEQCLTEWATPLALAIQQFQIFILFILKILFILSLLLADTAAKDAGGIRE